MPFAKITNTDRGPRGVYTVDGLVTLEPGETQSLDVPEAELVDLADYFAIADYTPSPAASEAPADALEGLSVAKLRALAAERGVQLPETGSGGDGRVLKADIIAAIVAGPVEPQGDALDAMTDEELRATVAALTGDEAPADADRSALLALARG